MINSQKFSLLFRRLGAYMIDVTIIFIWFFITQRYVLTPIRNSLGTDWMKSGALLEIYVILTISMPAWIYFTLTESSPWKASVGKRLTGLIVTDLEGKRIGFWKALLRTVIKLLPWEAAHMIATLPTSMWIDPQTGALSFDVQVSNFRYWLFSIVYVLLGVYVVTAFFNRRGRSIHDLISKTVVKIKKK